MKIKVIKSNAFTDSLYGGNPAGVVLDSPKLSKDQMKKVSKVLVVSETAFVCPINEFEYDVRFFSPTVEVDLCGHATIATFFIIGLERSYRRNTTLIQKTKAGVLPVDIYFSDSGVINRVMMTQGKPILKEVDIDFDEVADALHVSKEVIDTSMSKQIVSTGLFTLPICISSFKVLKNIKPDFKKVLHICNKIGVGSFHLFTFDTLEPESMYHARNFAPAYGINEDPVTGTANGAVSSYLVKNKVISKNSIVCEQGDIIGRPGRVFVEIEDDVVRVGGRACIVAESEIKI